MFIFVQRYDRRKFKLASVLIDNWTMSKLPGLDEKLHKDRKEVQDFLFALVLWDNVYSMNADNLVYDYKNGIHFTSLPAQRREYKDTLSDLCNIKKLKGWSEEFISVAEDIYTESYEKEDPMVAQGTILYMLLGYNFNLNILISSERTKFALDEGLRVQLLKYSRLNFMQALDKEVIEYYDEINKKIGNKVICYNAPVFIDYICKNAVSFRDAINIAMQLKYEPEVLDYRKTMDKMEKSLNEGNIIKFNQYISMIPEIVHAITHKRSITTTIEVGFSPLPSYSISLPFGIDLEKLRKLPLKFNLRFIKDIAYYGLNNRVYRI